MADVTAPAAPSIGLTSINPTDLTVAWTAVGDDGNTGTATGYELRYLSGVNCPIDQGNFASGALVATSAPLPAGSPESVLVTGLTDQTRYCFLLRVVDDAGNPAFSQMVETTTPDGTPPAASVLSGAIQGQLDLGLNWTCVGGDGTTGNPSSLEIRFLTGAACPVTASNVASSTLAGSPAVLTGCSTDSGLVNGLAQETSYCFVLRALDEAGNASISNNLDITTGDFTAPAPPALVASNATVNTLDISWVAVGDDGNTGTVTSHELRYATGALCPMGAAGFAAGTPVTLGAPAPGGTPSSAQATGLTADTQYCFLLRVVDNGGNTVFSNELFASTVDNVPPASALLSVTDTRPTSVTLAWTSPGDNGTSGTALTQQLRYLSGAACPIDSSNFATGTLASGLGTPPPGGTPSTFQVLNLTPGTSYCFALRVTDEANNNGLSNSLGVTTPDPVTQVGAIRQALRSAAATPVALSNLPVQGGVVSYVKPGIGAAAVGTVDGPGLFIQNANLGPAIFLAVDPTLFAPDLAAGDVVDFVATAGAWLNCTACTALNSLYAVTAITGATRTARNGLLPAIQDITNDPQFADAIGGAEVDANLGWLMESELTPVFATLGTPVAAGAGFVKFPLTTAGAGTPAANIFSLRMPDVFARDRGIAANCSVTVTATPLSRFNNEVQVSAWQSSDITSVSCPPLTAAITPAAGSTNVSEATDVVVTFNQPMNIASATGQPNAGPCAGSVQISADGFASCYGFNATWNFAQTVFTITPIPGLAYGTSYQVRVLAGVVSNNGNTLAADATSNFTTRTMQCNVPTHVVISQVYGAGNNTGATYLNDFVELYNPTNAAISLATYSIQYAGATGTTWNRANLSGSIAAHGFYLIQMSGGTTNGVALPPADAVAGGINMAAAAGKVALVSNQTNLPSGACPVSAALVDFVGFGTTATCSELIGGPLTPAPAPSASTSALRSVLCGDTDNNAADFTTFNLNPATPPRNAVSPLVPCAPCVANETGLTPEADYCNLQFPPLVSIQQGSPLPQMYGRVFEAGFTELPGPNPAITAEFGYGPAGTNPQWQPGWTWSNAFYNVQAGNDDEYATTGGILPLAGNYRYTFRFSTNGGVHYTYCDLGGAGSNAGLNFEPTDLGVLIVTP